MTDVTMVSIRASKQVFLACMAVVLLGGCRKQTNWAQFHFAPDHDGLNPYEKVLSPSNVGTLGLDWSYTIAAASPGEHAGVDSSPAVANGVVYVGSDFVGNNVYALKASTGAKLWQFTTGGGVDTSPAVANVVIYVGSDDFNVYALNASTGALLWKYTTSALVYSSPAVANGVVYVGSSDDNVYALHGRSGHLLWKWRSTNVGPLMFSSPAVANGVVYVGSHDSNVYALNAGTGALLWQYGTYGNLNSSPAVANGVVYVGSEPYDPEAGSPVYAFGLPGSALPAVPERPDPQTLSPNLSLPVSRLAAKLPDPDD
jgi:outer membrane protein assembly factor BamB